MKKQPRLVSLLTPEGEELKNQPEGFVPWKVYPRPRLKRGSFLCLNGEWELSVGASEKTEKILVPFPPEAILSGIGRTMPEGDTLRYKKSFSLPEKFKKSRTILHFGAVDQTAEVYLNGVFLGMHVGGYSPFYFDVTKHLVEENTLEVLVTDTLDGILPYGKQRKERGGMWYTPISGIWQTVWLESLPEQYISDIKIRSDREKAQISVSMNEGKANGAIVLDGEEFPLENGRATVTPKDPVLWSPENPHLYNFTLKVGDDVAESYFALRTLEVLNVGDVPRLCLNGEPYFFHGLLDQGYFSDGIFLPASPKGYERDILTAKKLGFNMLRKHIKTEPEIFYYYCDKLGIAVFQDMINNSDYSFVRDTALPTVGVKHLNDKRLHRNDKSRAAFLSGMCETVRRLSFHPSVCYWTIFNEGWGQFDHASAYKKLKRIDDTRFIDSVSGWFTPKKAKKLSSDLCSFHVYFKPVKLKKAKEKPIVLSEFGGYSYKISEHTFNLDDNYGYRTFTVGKELESALEALYTNEVLPAIEKSGLSAAVYTQLSDVEDETNGLITYDRRVIKVNEKLMKKIGAKLTEKNNNFKEDTL